MKKAIMVLLIVALCVSTMAGCGKKTNQPEKKDTASTTKSSKDSKGSTQNEKEEPIEIEWLSYNPDFEMDKEKSADVVQYMEDKFNVKLNVWYIARETFDEMINVRIAGGDMPDIFKPKSGSLGTYVKQGVAGEVSRETIKEFAPDLYALYEEYFPEGENWVRTMYEGKNYGYHELRSSADPSMVIWRKDWLEKFGYTEAPKTIEEFEDVLYKFTFEDPDGNGKDDTYGMSDFALNMIFGAYGVGQLSSMEWFGTNRMLKDGIPTFACIQPETKEALATLAKWYAMGIIDPEFVTSEHTSGHWATSQAFINGRIGLTGRSNPGHWGLQDDGTVEKIEMMKAANPNAEVLFATPPVGPTGLSGTNSDGRSGAEHMFTTKATADPKKVEKILQIANEGVSDFDHFVRVFKGVEGEDYEIRELDGKYISLQPEGSHPNQYGLSIFAPVHKPEYAKKLKPTPKDFISRTPGRTSGYTQPKVPSTDAYSKYAADLRRIAAEAFITIVTGEKPIDYFEEFVDNYLKNGGQETLDAMQGAYKDAMGIQ